MNARDTSDATAVPQLMTVGALAERWTIKPGTLREWARRGKIPSRKFGRLLVFDVDELRSWYATRPSGAVHGTAKTEAER